MEPLVLLLLGAVALVAGFLTLESFGPGYRIGRLLATTQTVTVADAAAAARDGQSAYVRVDGRVDSADDFPDENGRPLVFRRSVLELRRGIRWRSLDEQRQAVPFSVRQGLDEIGVAVDELEDGVVVVPREASGPASEVPDRVPAGTKPSTHVRYRVQLVSSIDHASVLGQPRLDAAGRPIMSAASRRPLIVSTLPDDEAMRILAGGRRGRSIAAASMLGAGLLLVISGCAWSIVRALA